MGAVQQALLAAAGGAGGGADPDFASVILLLHGANFTDYSPLAHTPNSTAACTANTADSNGTVGSVCFSSTSSSPSIQYPTSTDWAAVSKPTFTWEFWTKFASLSSFAFLMGQGSGNRLFKSSGSSPTFLDATTWALSNSTNIITAGVWQWWRLVSDGTTTSLYMGTAGDVNALRVATATVFSNITTTTVFDAMECTGGLGFAFKMMEQRITTTARNSPGATSIPMQTAPWPDS